MISRSFIFLVVWSGGYESNQYATANDREAAFSLAGEWIAEGLVEGDTVDILRINTATGAIKATNVA